jgi:hypothetical protein
MKDGWKLTSRHLTRSGPTVMMFIWQLMRFRLVGLSDATFASVSKSSVMQQYALLDIPRDLAFSGGGDGLAAPRQTHHHGPGEEKILSCDQTHKANAGMCTGR